MMASLDFVDMVLDVTSAATDLSRTILAVLWRHIVRLICEKGASPFGHKIGII